MSEADSIDLLSEVDLPFCDSRVLDELFIRSTFSILASHFRKFPWLVKIYEESGWSPKSLSERADLAQLPYLHFNAVNELALVNVQTDQRDRQLPNGDKTRIRLDCMIANSLRQMKITQKKIINQVSICATGEIARNTLEGTRLSSLLGSDNSSEASVITLAASNKPGLLADARELENKFDRLVSEGLPVILLCSGEVGFQFLELLSGLGKNLSLPAGSLILTRGMHLHGDNFSKIASYFSKVEQRLNIPRALIFDYYDVPCIGYPIVHCAFHRYHIPGFLEVVIRDPITLAPLVGNNTGVIQFISAFDDTRPNNSILTNDLGYIYEEACQCGLESKILQFKNGIRPRRLHPSKALTPVIWAEATS